MSSPSQAIVANELKVIAVLALLLLACEIGLRIGADSLSKDVAHLHHFADASQKLATASPGPNVQKVLFLGNSTTRFGVDGDEFVSVLHKRTDVPVVWEKVNPDNTALAEWYYLYKNFFHSSEVRPDVVVLGFEAMHLRDSPSDHPSRLAQFYCNSNDWPELTRFDLPSFESRMSFLASENSALWAHRDRVERRVLDSVIPQYRQTAQLMNYSQKMPASTTTHPTYARLESLLQLIRQDNVRIVLAAMPLAEEYRIDEGLTDIARRYKVPIVDCQHIEGITPDMFPDGVHMTATASKLYSSHLANTLLSRHVIEPTGSGHQIVARPDHSQP
ncbi:MAG: hypothetical protein R3C18_04820 [Planctomycetaceae bacterium]